MDICNRRTSWKKIVGVFHKKELQKTNQKEFR